MRIEPYNDSETKEVLLRLLNNEEFISFVKTNLSPNRSKFLSLPGSTFLTLQLFKSKVRKINTIDEFQTQVKKVLESVIKQTIDDFTFSGLEKLDPKKGYLFIGNHRDITLDSALCNHAIVSEGFSTTYNAIGDNLVNIDWMGDLLRLNKSFIISRSGNTKKEIYNNLMGASKYIFQLLSTKNLVWIAQRQGRSKDGIDKTDPAVLKMIHMQQRKNFDFEDFTENINIVPCSISYEFDPLDKEKAKTLINSNIQKTPDEDVKHIFKGITEKKGFVHLNFCPQIKGKFSPEELARKIDTSIHSNFQLWDSNYYCYYMLAGNSKKANEFTRGKKYFDELSSAMTNKELEYIMLQYANPVKLKEKNYE
tara:strand:+ start:4408 stop:5502 length:1095 start_codon:yes stop_codon:yes gene_type:complete